MRHLISVAALALFPVLATAADGLDWAYPVTPRPEPLDTLVLKQVPGSERAYTQAQIDDAFSPPDWFPDEHPTMPAIVARGEKPGGGKTDFAWLVFERGYVRNAEITWLHRDGAAP